MNKIKSIPAKYRRMIIIAVIIVSSVTLYSFYDKDFKIIKSLDIYASLFRELNTFYVDEIDPEVIMEKSINEMLNSLDPYTSFIPESKLKDYDFMTTGQYGGIGALIRKRGEYTIISEPYKGFPADKAGLMAGDTIFKIDGELFKGKDISDVSNSLKGTPNTPVTVTIKRLGVEKPFEVEIKREKINIKDVPYYGMLNETTGYIKLNNFTKGASKEVKDALEKLKEQHGAQSIILDLRGNPGGLLIESVAVSNLFVDKGNEIVSTKGKVKQWDQTYKTKTSAYDPDIPLVVMVSRGSASASEIVAGAMQDLDRGVIVGKRTFGKGLVQTTRNLSYNTKLKVTTAKYYIPSGRCIQALDYSNRNEDGSVGNIPDSLISEFKTRNGRTVYDGGGIKPDLEVEPYEFSEITRNLVNQNIIFDFATLFVTRNDTINSPENFSINDDIYFQFIDYVTSKDFEYETRTEKNLKELIDVAKKEKYHDMAREEFDQLVEAVSHDIDKDLLTFREDVSRMLKLEIITRYYYQEGRLRASLQDDPQLEKALEMAADHDRINQILASSTQAN